MHCHQTTGGQGVDVGIILPIIAKPDEGDKEN